VASIPPEQIGRMLSGDEASRLMASARPQQDTLIRAGSGVRPHMVCMR